MKKIILFGSTGFLGSYLTECLKNSYKLYCFGRSKKTDFNIDLLEKKKLIKILSDIKPNIIINSVAETNLDHCQRNKKICYEKNFEVVKNFTTYCSKNKVNIIQISTDQLYDGNGKNSSEKKIKIQNYYAKTKYLAEKEILKYNGCVLRTNFFGYNLAENKGLLNWMIESSKKNREIKLYNNIYFSPIYIKTLAKYVKKICNKFHGGIYNVGSRDSITKSDFIKKIDKYLNLNLKYIESNYNYSKTDLVAKRPLNMSMNTKKFERKYKIKLPNVKNEIIKLKKDVRI